MDAGPLHPGVGVHTLGGWVLWMVTPFTPTSPWHHLLKGSNVPAEVVEVATQQFRAAANMTDQLGALSAVVAGSGGEALKDELLPRHPPPTIPDCHARWAPTPGAPGTPLQKANVLLLAFSGWRIGNF